MTAMATPSNSARILLRGGTLLIHDQHNHVKPTAADLLIEDGLITKIEHHIDIDDSLAKSTRIMDCHGKIVTPGFVSTHHHLYQTARKGVHGNHSLISYFPTGNMVGSLYSLEDAFWGQLSGALEAIDAGTTTVVDHSSLNYTPDYPKAVLQALITSGLRTIYCYCAPRTVTWSPFSMNDDYLSPAFLSDFSTLAAAAPFAHGRVHVGLGIDNLDLPRDVLHNIFSHVRGSGAQLITTHGVGGPMFNNPPSALQILQGHGLLGPDVLVSHGNYPKEDDAQTLREKGAFLSSTPNTELQMGWPPVSLRPEFQDHGSIGVDCHSWGVSFMPGQMRMLLQQARCERSLDLAKKGKLSRVMKPTVEEVFNLGTVGGAKAVGMEGQIGKISVGMKADLVVFGTSSPAMLAAAEEDPVAAIVLHSSERDVEVVIVHGIVRKENGRLLDVEGAAAVCGGQDLGVAGRTITWEEAVSEVLKSRKNLKDKTKDLDFVAAEEGFMNMLHVYRAGLLEQ